MTQQAVEEAKSFLTLMLGNGPVPTNEVNRAAHDIGISLRTLGRARSALHVKWERRGVCNGGRGEGRVVLLPLATSGAEE